MVWIVFDLVTLIFDITFLIINIIQGSLWAVLFAVCAVVMLAALMTQIRTYRRDNQ